MKLYYYVQEGFLGTTDGFLIISPLGITRYQSHLKGRPEDIEYVELVLLRSTSKYFELVELK